MPDEKERLFIKKIDIENAGRFYGSGHSITLSDSPDKNITVIIGLSGRGKSTIHDLIYWCLYGKHKQHTADEHKNLDYGLINIDALNNLSKGNSVTASVTLSLHNNKGEKYLITREITATFNRDSTARKFNPENNSRVPVGIYFEVTAKMKMKGADEPVIERDTGRINREIEKHFPQHLSDFFLFDGENLIKFQNQTSSDFIRDGITKVSGLGILADISQHANMTATNIHKHIGSKSAGTVPYANEVGRLSDRIEEINVQIGEHRDGHKKYKDMHDMVAEKIKKNEEGSKLIGEQESAQKSKKTASRELKKIDEQIKNTVFEKLPRLLIRETLEKSEQIFARLEDEDKIPPSISRSAIEKILNSNPLRCVCGREFEKNDASWRKLNQTKGAIIEDDLSQGITLGRGLISQIIDNASIEKSRSTYNELVNDRRNKSKEVQDYADKIDDLAIQLKNIQYDKEEDLGKRKEEYFNKIVEHELGIRDKSEKLRDYKEQLKDAQKTLKEEIEREGMYQSELSKATLAKAVSRFAKDVEKKVEESFRTETEKTTNKYFLESAPQKQDFDHVDISENYDIGVKDHNGLAAHLSKGQAHVLGLSYVAGIREITHTNTFLIIDSPLHNISGTARNEISEVFSKYLPGIQIVLLVTDTEYLQSDREGADPVRDILQKNGKVWNEYSIEETTVNGGIASREIKEYVR